MTVDKLKQDGDIPNFIIDIAQFLAKISNHQRFYSFAIGCLTVLALFLGLLAAESRDWIILALPALGVALIGACFAGRWWQNKRTIEELLQHDYFDLCDKELYDVGKYWLKTEEA
jgi:hypothetical protein